MKPLEDPPITLTKSDYDRLSGLADLRRDVVLTEYLSNELNRARIVPTEQASSAVRIGSRIRFRDLATNAERTVVLVMPNAADIEKGTISVLTPVGIALLGLSEGQAISFTAPGGQVRSLLVIDVVSPRAENSGRSERPLAQSAQLLSR